LYISFIAVVNNLAHGGYRVTIQSTAALDNDNKWVRDVDMTLLGRGVCVI